MSKVNWTEKQREVIELRNCNILVSAAAGSGKTAVLVERILRKITDTEHPIDIDRFLIVTFTKAAAAEMKERLSKAIHRAVEQEPENQNLRRQLTLLHNAQISTIHSFCGYVIQNYFHRIGIDPSYRIGNDAELKMLQMDVLGELLEERYSDPTREFIDLVESYRFDKRDTELEQLILQVYSKAMSNPWPYEWYSLCSARMDVHTAEELEKSPIVTGILEYSCAVIRDICDELDNLIEICNESDGPKAYAVALGINRERLSSLRLEKNYENMSLRLQEIEYERLAPIRKTDQYGTEEEIAESSRKAEYIKKKWTEYRKVIKELKDTFFVYGMEEYLVDIQTMANKLNVLLDLAMEFQERYTKEKRERGLADYNDLEQMAIQILMEDKETPSEAAETLSEQFHEIMIDEYQDSNMVQDTILRSVSTEREGRPNIFMVGDVKQSIYRFRLACPELFTDKLYSYSQKEGPYRLVNLRRNFRSRKSIIDIVNHVFQVLMKTDIGGIFYDSEAALYQGAVYPVNQREVDKRADVVVIQGKENQEEREAECIAQKIKKMTDPKTGFYIYDENDYRLTQYRDIVILFRSTTSYIEPMERILNHYGIPTSAERKTGFFDTDEIRMMVMMFRTLDNPRQDIPLTATLHSPMFHFTDEELTWIRATRKKRCVYQSLLDYVEEMKTQPEEQTELLDKCTHFLQTLHELRSILTFTKVSDIIQRIYDATGIQEYILSMSDGVRRGANLNLLMRQAEDFDGTSYHGLFQFVRYLERLKQTELDRGEAGISSENDNVVRLMTIHKSKGLEFPICIIAGMGKSLGGSSNRQWLLLNSKLGMASECIDNKLRYHRDTLWKRYIQQVELIDNLGEELRILYVAMTRAKEKLIFVGAIKEKEWGQYIDEAESMSFSFIDRLHMKTYYDMLLPIAFNQMEYFQIENVTKMDSTEQELNEYLDRELDVEYVNTFHTEEVYDEELHNTLEKLEHFQYAYDIEELPVKVSVSDLKKKSMEEEETESFHVFQTDIMEKSAPIPAFCQTKKSTKMQGAQYGTVWHQVMAMLDFNAAMAEQGVSGELARLVKEGCISEEESAWIQSDRLMTFLSSPLGLKMAEAQKEEVLFREQPFVYGVPAREALPETKSKEMVLIQGIIDAFYETETGIVLMDYKTDSLKPGEEMVLIKRYQTQMKLYRDALESMTSKRVEKCYLYSFSLGKSIELK